MDVDRRESRLSTAVQCVLAFTGATLIIFLPSLFLLNAGLRNVALALAIALPLSMTTGISAAAIQPIRKRIAGALIF